jgi:hypothetical protein
MHMSVPLAPAPKTIETGKTVEIVKARERVKTVEATIMVLVALLLLATACVSQDGPFTASRKPDKPLYEARPHCKEETRSSDGTVDWNAYEECMEELGWVKQTAPMGGGQSAPSMGGSSY